MEVVKTRDVPGLAQLYLARVGGDEGRMIEFVDTLEPGVGKDRKWVLMVSTQIGCAVGCTLCDAGALGYWGNLSSGEMLEQVRHVLAANPALDPAAHPKLKIHFARMGEPALNPAVLEALGGLRDLVPSPGLMPSVSTVAPDTPVAERFLEELKDVKDRLYGGGWFQLQFSLHATDDETRRTIVPIRSWTLARIAEYGTSFRKPGDRKITLNFAPPPGAELDPDAVARVFGPEDFLIKVTPVNPTRTAEEAGHTHLWMKPPDRVDAFASRLKGLGYDVILSPSLPEEIAAATSCGQLWSEALKEAASTRRRNLRREHAAYVKAADLEAKAAAWKEAVRRSRPAPPPAKKPALLIVDMQDFFMSPRSPAFLPPARAIAHNAARLVRAFREAGLPVAYTVHAYEDPATEAGPMGAWWRKACLASSPEANVTGALAPEKGEPVFRKTRYSAFSNSDVEPWLRRLGAESLVVCGVMTHLCVESSARDAFDLGFDVRIPLDATAAVEEEQHVGSLRNAAHGFAAIHSTEEILQCLKSS